jgi:phospholipid/cholesterol/gamma-HCH transport system permease protein
MEFEKIGSGVLRRLGHARDTALMLLDALGRTGAVARGPVREVFYRQLYFTGIQAMGVTAAVGAVIGIVTITQVANIVGVNAVLTGRILVWIVVRELGPLLAAIFVIARSSTAVAAELASMNVNGEVRALRAMGIDPMTYLIAPRIAAVAVSVFILTFYFQVAAVFGGLSLASLVLRAPFLAQLRSIFSALGVFEIGVSIAKGMVFGVVIAGSACYHGMRVRTSITEVPQVTTAAVMQSLVLIVAADAAITLVSFV